MLKYSVTDSMIVDSKPRHTLRFKGGVDPRPSLFKAYLKKKFQL